MHTLLGRVQFSRNERTNEKIIFGVLAPENVDFMQYIGAVSLFPEVYV